MTRILNLLTVFILCSSAVCSQTTYVRQPSETVDDFISSVTDTLPITHQIIKTSTLDKKGTIYIYFLDYTQTIKHDDKTGVEYNRVTVYSLITYDTTTFYQVTIDTLGFDNNGNERSEIEAAFFANCDKDKEQELLITFSTFYNRHYMAGQVYKTYAYNFPTHDNMIWKKDEIISLKFDDSDIGVIDGNEELFKEHPEWEPKTEPHQVKYNLAINIKRQLKEWGY